MCAQGALRQQQQQSKATPTSGGGPSAVIVRNPLPPNMSREEFRRKTRTIAKDVEVVQAPPQAMSESAIDADAYGGEGDQGRGGGAGKAFVTTKSATRKIGFAGTGGRSGTGRVAGKSAGGGGGKRPAGAAAGGAGGAAAVPALLREADRAVVQSGTDSDEDSESDVSGQQSSACVFVPFRERIITVASLTTHPHGVRDHGLVKHFLNYSTALMYFHWSAG